MPVRVCVVGAGAAGLTAVKWCLQEGLQPQCFDKRSSVGGIWSQYDHPEGKEDEVGIQCKPYASCITNDNKEAYSFSDFRYPDSAPMYLPAARVGQYLEDYADHFNLRPYITLETSIDSINKLEDGRWKVTTRRLFTSGDVKDDIYDAVIVCCGSYGKQYIPSIKGLGYFQGEKIHAGSYSRPKQCRGKRVLVIGGSNSAGEVSCDISRESKQVYLSTRDGLWAVTRLIGGVPAQLGPLWSRYINERYDIKQYDGLFGHMVRSRFNFEAYCTEPKRPLWRQAICIVDDIEYRLACGTIKMKPEVREFTKSGVVFSDGSEEQIDTIVFCTGFRPGASLLNVQGVNVGNMDNLDLYKNIFPVDCPNFAVLGCGAIFGPVIPALELGARIVTRVFSGKMQLPTREDMLKSCQAARRRHKDIWGTTEYYDRRQFWTPAIEDLAAVLGVKPTMGRLFKLFFTDPRLAYELLFAGIIPPHYRLYGPHANWDQARRDIFASPGRLYAPLRTIKYDKKPAPSNKGMTVPVLAIAIGISLGLYCYIKQPNALPRLSFLTK